MKMIIALLTALFLNNVYAYQCQDFMDDQRKVEAMNYVAQSIYKYSDHVEFCEKENFLDLELYLIPNYFYRGEEDDDHYKFMVHYAYSSCTYIYNITKKHITNQSCYSTW